MAADESTSPRSACGQCAERLRVLTELASANELDAVYVCGACGERGKFVSPATPECDCDDCDDGGGELRPAAVGGVGWTLVLLTLGTLWGGTIAACVIWGK